MKKIHTSLHLEKRPDTYPGIVFIKYIGIGLYKTY
jgi:hypothetical protein